MTETFNELRRTDPTDDDHGPNWLSNWKTRLLVGTWNVRTLYKSGKATTLEEELYRYKIDIATLQEIRWPGTGKTQLDKGYVLYCTAGRIVTDTRRE